MLYELQSDGGIGRDKFIFDGKDMYLISACATWNTNDTYGLSYISYARIKEWKYTDKGWFCYELCVPEPPEVTEIVDGSCLVRIKPLSKEQRKCQKDAYKVWGIREIIFYARIGILTIWKNWTIMECMNICMP